MHITLEELKETRIKDFRPFDPCLERTTVMGVSSWVFSRFSFIRNIDLVLKGRYTEDVIIDMPLTVFRDLTEIPLAPLPHHSSPPHPHPCRSITHSTELLVSDVP